MSKIRFICKVSIAAAASMVLSGCYYTLFPESEAISEEPLFDARTGRAKPFEPGGYDICTFNDGVSNTCWEALASRDDTNTYRIIFTDDKQSGVHIFRFRRLAKGAWVAQERWERQEAAVRTVSSKSDYFLIEQLDADWLVTPIYCEGAAVELRRKYAIAGELSPMGCTVKTRRAVMGLAKSFRDAGPDRPPLSTGFELYGTFRSRVILSKRQADDAGA